MNWIIDTGVFQKLFAYHRDKTNNDQQYNVEKLYNYIFKKSEKVIVPIFCLYELLNKSMKSGNKIKMLKFFAEFNISIGLISNGKVKYKTISNQDLEDLDLEKTIQYCFQKKQEFEIQEVIEYVKYTLFLIKYLVADILVAEDKNIDLIAYVFNIYEANQSKFYSKVDEDIKKSFQDGYLLENVKDIVKKKVLDIYKKFMFELYSLTANQFEDKKSVCDKEITCLNKMATSLDYIKNKISFLQKHHNIKKYTYEINKLYNTELKRLHYPKEFRNYFLFIIDKQIYSAKFDKNDSTDSLIYLLKKPNNYIISSDNTINNYLAKKHKNNFKFVHQFIK